MANVNMPAVDALRETFPEPAKDTKLNLGSISNSDFLEADQIWGIALASACLLYTSDAADERSRVDLGGRRIIKKKKQTTRGTRLWQNEHIQDLVARREE